VPKPVELKGRPASPGIACGPVVRLDEEISGRLPTGDVARELAALETAVARATAQIEQVMASADDATAEILEFQAAMLSDDELIGPARKEIESGSTAEAGWLAALSEQIAGYETSAEDYFRARSADLKDIRDRVLRNLAGGEPAHVLAGAVLVAEDVTPTRFLETDWSQGGALALSGGSAGSHVAMLARSRGVPMVVGLGPFLLDGHSEAIVDGSEGTVVLSPAAEDRARFERRRAALRKTAENAARHILAPAVTADGTPIRVMVNITRAEEIDSIDVAACDGVGLMRTEFLFSGGRLLDEETQYRAYAKVLDWGGGRPVVIRTLDAGGDKPIQGLTVDEPNPFLGLRGIRLSLARSDIFRVQLRALARAARHGDLRIMLPMVSAPEEFSTAAALLDRTVAEFAAEGIAAVRPPLGIMVEVPAVAIVPEAFLEAAFFSIGSNDLTQYVTAAARDSRHVADLCDAPHPAVIRLIAGVAEFGRKSGVEVSLCGDAASDPALVPALLEAGLRSLSVAPAALGAVKAAIADVRLGDRDDGLEGGP
jgi:phosphotransferase system enzyme I (PtsI)